MCEIFDRSNFHDFYTGGDFGVKIIWQKILRDSFRTAKFLTRMLSLILRWIFFSLRPWAPLKGQCHEIFCFCFFYESVSPQPQSIPLGPFQIFSKIRGDIRKSRRTTGVNDTGGKFCHQFPLCCWHRWQICHQCQRRRRQIATGINDTGGKFATGVNDTSGK